MPEVRPFRGLRYDVNRVGDLSNVICPPYDVISPEAQQAYYRKSPHNVIRLELGESKPSDLPDDNRYSRAAAFLNTWLDEGAIVREERPAFYVLEHRFVYEGAVRRRLGLIAVVRLEEWSTGAIRPHEVVSAEPLKDRLALMQTCRVGLSPILGMFCHKKNGLLSLLLELAQGEPIVSATDTEGVTHSIWVVTDTENITRISSFCAKNNLYISDGHHRYETALGYQREQLAAHTTYSGEESFNFVMMTLMDAGDPGLLIQPTHRLVRLREGQTLSKLRNKLGGLFDVNKVPVSGSNPHDYTEIWSRMIMGNAERDVLIGAYGLYAKCLCSLSAKNKSAFQGMLPVDRSQAWKELDVSLLHWVVLRGIMGLETAAEEECVAYTRDAAEAVSLVNSGEYQLAFLLRPMPSSSIIAVADAGDRMPQKSTYFFPKPPAGLVMYPL